MKNTPRKRRQRNGLKNEGKYSQLKDDEEIYPYCYKPLESPRHIRLAQVRESLIGHRILVKFTHVHLDNPIRPRDLIYRAISYRWGSSERVDRVWLHNSTQYLEITRSAATVLRYLIRARIRGYIWIDALCINQDNATEKSVQVPLMRDVYSRAKEVVAYLGEKSEDSDVAMKFIRLLKKRFEKVDLRRYNVGPYAEFEGEVRNTVGLNLGKDVDLKWRALHNLMQRPWFNRLWVVQEVVLATKAAIVCGKKRVPWETLTFVLDVLRDSSLDYLLKQRLGEDGIPRNPQGVHCLLSIAWVLGTKRVMLPQGLQRLLLRFRSFAATDPRDFIFALLGIADSQALDWPKADYEKSLEEIFESWTKHLFLREGELRLLHIAGIGQPRSDLNLPSWVPDWSCRSWILQDAETVIFGDVDQGIRYQASRGTKPEVRNHKDLGCLSFMGRIIDTVDTCTEILSLFQSEHFPPPKETLIRRDKFLRNLNRLMSSLTHRKKDERQWKTLIANRLGDKIPPKGLSVQMGNQYMAWHRADLRYYRDAESSNFSDEMDLEIWKQNRLAAGDEVRHRHRQFINALPNQGERAVLTTKRGYVGIGPRNLQLGDQLCIIHGASTPFIIRPSRSNEFEQREEYLKYQLVGECYFDDLMIGRGLAMGSKQEIILC